MSNLICPYTLRPIASLESSCEHIVPEAIGGSRALSLRADKQRNSAYGAGLDLDLVRDEFILYHAVVADVKTKSGPVVWRRMFKAEDEAGSEFEVAFTAKGISAKFRRPVLLNDENELIGVRAFGKEAADQELKRVIAEQRAKGRVLTAVERESTGIPLAGQGTIIHDRSRVAQGIAKIAYLMTVFTLGDDYLETPQAEGYRDIINRPRFDATEWPGFNVKLVEAPKSGPFGGHFAQLDNSTHYLLCHVNDTHLITMVRLFDSDQFSFAFVSDAPTLKNVKSALKVVRMDAKNKKVEWVI